MFRHFLVYLSLSMTALSGFSQSSYRAGTLPQLNLNFKLNKSLKLNTKLESRQIFSERSSDEPAIRQFRYERTDLAMVLTTKLSADNAIGGGYLIRLEDNKFTHRLIQQFSHVRNFDAIGIAHRIVTDETFSAGEATDVRIRYRLGLEKALNGQHIDPKEFYAKFNNEYLGIWSRERTDLEIRGLLAIGYNATDQNKVELGVEYRVNEFNEPARAQQFWLTIGWYISM